MEELTIKEKAKRYDEAIERAEKWRNAPNVDKIPTFANRVIDEIFPEFEENEDEKIRKEIIDFLELPHPQFVGKRDHKIWITWLEKQENKKDNLSVDFVLGYLGIKPAYKDGNAWCILLGDNIQEGICGFGGTKEEALVAFMKELIEKQGEQIPANSAKTCKDEQKPNPYSGTSFEYNGHTWGMCARDNGVELLLDGELKAFLSLEKSFIKEQDPCEHCNDKFLNCHNFPCIKKRAFEHGKSILEVIKEEKVDNANKVEPKFKIGDTMRTLQEAKDGWTEGMPFVVSIDNEYYHCNSEKIAIKDQDEYEYPPMNRKHGVCDSCDEQKPVDKVEPKFKVGDWIIDKSGLVQHVLDFRGGIYSCTYSSFATGCESNYHLWTIKDAKDGDVLKEGSCIFILRKMKSKNTANTHCCLFDDGDFNLSPTLSLDVDSTFPATKEQRDLLFAKMKEAGYAFELYNKEMMKIEDELITGVEIPFGAKDSELEEVFYSIPNGFHAEIKDDKVVIKKGEQKSWSKEDEEVIDTTVSFLEEFSSKDYIVRKHCINWLKSVKDRIQPQNTCKSSDEHYELEEFAKIVRCNLTGISKAVQKLFESKYLQLTGNKMYGGLKD